MWFEYSLKLVIRGPFDIGQIPIMTVYIHLQKNWVICYSIEQKTMVWMDG